MIEGALQSPEVIYCHREGVYVALFGRSEIVTSDIRKFGSSISWGHPMGGTCFTPGDFVLDSTRSEVNQNRVPPIYHNIRLDAVES